LEHDGRAGVLVDRRATLEAVHAMLTYGTDYHDKEVDCEAVNAQRFAPH